MLTFKFNYTPKQIVVETYTKNGTAIKPAETITSGLDKDYDLVIDKQYVKSSNGDEFYAKITWTYDLSLTKTDLTDGIEVKVEIDSPIK